MKRSLYIPIMGRHRLRRQPKRVAAFRRALATLHWTQKALAGMLGVSALTINRWANGHHRMPPPVALWLADLARHHQRHPPPLRLGRSFSWTQTVQRQFDIPQLPQEQQRDVGAIPADAGNDPAVSGDHTVADSHSVPWHVYRPPGS